MLFGLDGVELSLIIVFSTLFISILSGYPVAFGLSGAAVVSFALLAFGYEFGWLLFEYQNGDLVLDFGATGALTFLGLVSHSDEFVTL